MRQLARDGVPLSFADLGKGAPPILLIHDHGSDHTSFGPQIDHFRSGHRVVAVDLRGHGESGGESGQEVAELAGDIAWLCYELGVHKPALIGHGFGGAIAVEVAARHPDLPAAVVALDTPVGAPRGPGTRRHWLSGPCQVPVLYVDAGTEATDLDHLREMCTHVTVSRFEEAGHCVHQEWPDQINALIESFLARARR